MKQYIRTVFTALGLLSITSSCVKLDFSDKIPGLDVTLNTDWDLRGDDVEIPSSYLVCMNNEELSYDKYSNVLLPDYPYGDYFAVIYNPAEKITVENHKNFKVEVDENLEVAPDPEWLFTSALDILYDETSRDFTAKMKQQIRQLNVIVSYTGEVEPIGMECTVSGVAAELELDLETLTEKYKKSSTVRSLLNKNDENSDFESNIRLLGVVANDIQIFNLEIALTANYRKTISENISEFLEEFNIDKHIPLTLHIKLDDSFDPSNNSEPKIDISVSIEDWIVE